MLCFLKLTLYNFINIITMRELKIIILSLFVLSITTSCQEEDQVFGDLTVPSNVDISIVYLDDIDGDGIPEETAAPGLGSGEIKISVTADNAVSYQVIIQEERKVMESDGVSHIFSTLGNNTYPITVLAFGTGGNSTSQTIEVNVLSLYEPPADLLEMLHANDTRTWRIRNEVNGHFGLGPVDGSPFAFFSAPIDNKVGVGMYDDRYIFNQDGTFIHITDSTNDDPDEDITGTVFGREVLVNELGGVGGGTQNGADIENYVYEDYSEQWALTAPGGIETINLTGIGFLGYYIGGDHKYQILSRSANEMVLKTIDGNGEFSWGFILVAE